MDSVELVGGLDPDPQRCASFSQRGVPVFATLDALISQAKPDIVCVCSAVSTHEQIVRQVADAGIHILCEKPLAPDAAGAQRMVSHCAARGVTLFYGSTQRYLPAIAAAKALIANGEIGDVQMIREDLIGGAGLAAFTPMNAVHYPAGGPGGGGWGLVDHGIHMLDLFPWLVGDAISSAYGYGNISGANPRPEVAIIEMGKAATIGHLLYSEITFPSTLPNEGIFGVGEGWGNRGYTDRGAWNAQAISIDVYGAQGSIRIFGYPNLLFLNTAAGLRKIATEPLSPPVQFARQMEAFLLAIERGEDAPVNGEAGVRALQALEAIYQSQSLGRKIMIDSQSEISKH
jgi:predicted dehydrogenase